MSEHLPPLTDELLAAEKADLSAGCTTKHGVDGKGNQKPCPVTQSKLEPRADLVQIVTQCASCERRHTVDCAAMTAEEVEADQPPAVEQE